jgi:homoserine acetyltransferase
VPSVSWDPSKSTCPITRRNQELATLFGTLLLAGFGMITFAQSFAEVPEMMQHPKRKLRSATGHIVLGLCLVPGCLSVHSRQTVAAGSFVNRIEGNFVIKDFRFNSGEVLPELRLRYVTLGIPHRNPSGEIDNAVLLLHSTGSDSTEFFDPDFSGPLLGTGQPLDLANFFLIIPDSIGHGKSSKPSNGLRAHFPHYGNEDMVAAQPLLVTNKFGISHLRLVLGVSMGGMHTWLWGERYPEMMDALFPISALPVETGGRNRLWRHMVVEKIRNDPEWKNGDYQEQPHCLIRLAPLVVIMTGNPARQYDRYPTRAAADKGYDHTIELAGKHATRIIPFINTMLRAITIRLPNWKK